MTELPLFQNKPNIPEFSVSEISEILKMTIEETFSFVRIKGEISGLKLHTNGHIYFNLKDDKSVLNSVCWKGTAASLPFKPEDGLEVICSGKITTYAARSNYQLTVSKMEVAGIGALLALLEKRKQKLAAEGLFDESRKKPLPFLPKTIGVITSPTGAVIKDILHRLQDRYPVHVLVWGVLVQGQEAAKQVADAIHGFNNLPAHLAKPDLLIVARGGGSIEDLMPFNEEIVIRAVAESQIPIISAVGHETDTTLIDFVSDRRAPTPTAAAEMAVPVRVELLSLLNQFRERLKVALPNLIKLNEIKLHRCSNVLMQFAARLQSALERLGNLHIIMRKSFDMYLSTQTNKVHMFGKLLESFHYKKVLERGFAIVKDGEKILHSISQIMPNKKLEIEFADGQATVYTDPKKPSAQGSLFD
jgi:exodeoxyribonuclease VII large subunit